MKKDRSSIRRIVLQSFRCGLFIVGGLLSETMTAQNRAVVFDRDFSPAEGLVIPQEKPYRDEICLNGFWDLQCVAIPSSWKSGSGIAPELSAPKPDQWEKVKIKIPSAINVNDWGREAVRSVKEHSVRMRRDQSPFQVIRNIGYIPVWDGCAVTSGFLRIGSKSGFCFISKLLREIV